MDERTAGWLLALAIVALFAGAVRADRRVAAIGVAALLLLYLLALVAADWLLPASPWGPVIAALCVGLAVLPLLASGRLDRAALGLVPPRAGSAAPAAMATAAFIVVQIGIMSLRRAAPHEPAWTLIGVALAAACSEELVMRGVLLALADRASPPRWRVLGAPIGWGGMAITAAFIVLHGLRPGLLWGVAPAALLYLWLRARTGSLLPPLAAHLLVNLAVLFMHH